MSPVPDSYPKKLAMAAIDHLKTLPSPGSKKEKESIKIVEDILNGDDSTLEKIKKAYNAMKKNGACNSKHQALAAFQFILSTLIEKRIANPDNVMPLELLSLRDHFIVQLDNSVICDPKLQACYLVSDLKTLISKDHTEGWGLFSDPSTYFKIDNHWFCSSCFNTNNKASRDEASMRSTYKLFAPVYHDSPLAARREAAPEAEETPDISPAKR
ncbi:hypothetical protein [Legionella birminghamensis]|nr:hypothetical protein [Legionella birminghamensis]